VLLKSVLLQNLQALVNLFLSTLTSRRQGSDFRDSRYVSDQWISFGTTALSSSGGLASTNYPCLFNTSSVGNDPGLGSPNEYCTPSGPGKSLEGGPLGAGPNCDPMGNALIIQNSDESITIPDDSVDGGSILFDFSPDLSCVSRI
jgi:hypothetical protein